MPHIRVLRHYIHTPYLVFAGLETLLIAAGAVAGYYTVHEAWPSPTYLPIALTFAVVLVFSMAAMGVYESRVREGFMGMTLRTAVAIFLIGTMLIALLSYLFPVIAMERAVLLFAVLETFVIVVVIRWIAFQFISEDALKSRIVVLGAGQRALKIATRMRRKSDRRAFILLGFIDLGSDNVAVRDHNATVLPRPDELLAFCVEQRVDEIVVAVDASDEAIMPVNELVDCRLSGVDVCDVQEFFEREACKLDVDILRPSWLAFSDGFVTSRWRNVTKRLFDIIVSIFMLIVTSPIMIITAVLVLLEHRFQHSVLYRQQRVGLNDSEFRVFKFRSMRPDVADDDTEFATYNDPRVTRVGRFIRKTRIDELPQLLNVLRGEMSFVGPRPEQPVHVDRFALEIPYYDQRHRIKPGITGWAQLCYPYGTSVADAKEKLQYDLYYLKNQSLFLDLVILLQTVEVVLIGEGAR